MIFIIPTPKPESVESSAEASGFLVVPLVFKTSERRAASLAGSIPVRLRHQRCPRPGEGPICPGPAAAATVRWRSISEMPWHEGRRGVQ